MNVVALKKWLWQSRYLWIFLVPLFIMLPKAQAHDNAITSAQSPDIIGGQEADIGEYPWQAESVVLTFVARHSSAPTGL